MGSVEFLCSSAQTVVICGAEAVFIYDSWKSVSNINEFANRAELNLKKILEENEAVKSLKAGTKAGNAVCASISPESNYVAVADNEKRLLVFKRSGEGANSWNLELATETEKRLLKILFTDDTKYAVLTDKSGDVWSLNLEASPTGTLRKTLGHCSVILDTVVNEAGNLIYTCDRDEKIRESRFPQGYIIEGYFLGHREAVVGIQLLKEGNRLISVDLTGRIILWDTKTKKKDQVLELSKCLSIPEKEDVCSIKFCEFRNILYLVAKVTNSTELPVFAIDLASCELKLLHVKSVSSNCFDFAWMGSSLYVIDVGSGSEITSISLTDGVVVLSESVKDERIVTQVNQFVKCNQSTVIPLRKLTYNEDPDIVPAKQMRMSGPADNKHECIRKSLKLELRE